MAAAGKKLDKAGRKRIIQVVITILFQPLIFFIAAGTLNIPRAWYLFAFNLTYFLITGIILAKKNPEVISARSKIQKGTKTWDKIIVSILSFLMIALIIVAGLDLGRFKWLPISYYYAIPGFLIYLAASFWVQWAIVVNRHFEGTVRIQKDRDHKVVSTGPYKYMRHPGYTAIMLQNLMFSIIIGSATALIPGILIAILFVIRTALEDRTLQNELKGYKEYTGEVKYRLVPGIW